MEIRPDHGWETVGQGAPPGRGARGGGSEPGWAASHDPHHCVHGGLSGPHGPHPRSARGRSTKERGRRRGRRRWWGSDECAKRRGRSCGRGRCVVAPCNARVLAPNKSPAKSRVFSNFLTEHNSKPRLASPSPTLGARAANPAGTARTRAVAHGMPPQHRCRPPRRESCVRHGPAGRPASPSPPSRKSR
jgi:hypothetical protein